MPPLRIVQLVAACDVLTGIVVTAIGVIGDLQLLTVIGSVLVLSGFAVTAVLAWQRNKPEAL